jgi:hypothetical protein
MIIWNKLCLYGIFYGHLVIKWQFGIFSTVLVHCDKKNLAALVSTEQMENLNFQFSPRFTIFSNCFRIFSPPLLHSK